MGVSFNSAAATTFAVVNATTVTATVPPGAKSGNVTTASGTCNGVAFMVTYADLVVTTTTSILAGTYNSITVNSPGVITLAGNVTVNTSTTVSSGATLNDGCNVLGGVGSFALAASGATGAIQNTGARSFASDASYVYNGTATQSTGSGLRAQVRNLTTANDNDVTLS